MENYNDIKELFTKYLDNSISREEYNALLQYFGKQQDEGELHRLVVEALSSDTQEYDHERLGEVVDTVELRLREKLQPRKTTLVKLWPRIAVAAAVVAVVFSAGLFYINQKPQKRSSIAGYQKDIDPGSNKAYLTLSNGKRIALTDAGNGSIASQSNVQITKTADGQLVYTVAKNKSDINAPLEYNTIETPNGGKYDITLPDGTTVSINAASTLKFPVSFASLKERRVQLQGEAYFQVAHNKQVPFRVSSPGQLVEVLGTHFNINAYANEVAVKTTLLEGSVKILPDHAKNFKILKPGEQGTLQDDVVEVAKADTEQALGWRNGDFVFNGEDLKAVMRQVARWYDVEVEYKGEVNISGIVSAFPRNKKLSQLLKALEASEGVHFKIEGRRVLVMP